MLCFVNKSRNCPSAQSARSRLIPDASFEQNNQTASRIPQQPILIAPLLTPKCTCLHLMCLLYHLLADILAYSSIPACLCKYVDALTQSAGNDWGPTRLQEVLEVIT